MVAINSPHIVHHINEADKIKHLGYNSSIFTSETKLINTLT